MDQSFSFFMFKVIPGLVVQDNADVELALCNPEDFINWESDSNEYI